MEDRTVVAYGCRKTNNLICGMEGKHVVAYARLPSLPRLTAESKHLSKHLMQIFIQFRISLVWRKRTFTSFPTKRRDNKLNQL